MSKDCGLKWDILMELEELDKVGQRKKISSGKEAA